jgi:hypothetical protein
MTTPEKSQYSNFVFYPTLRFDGQTIDTLDWKTGVSVEYTDTFGSDALNILFGGLTFAVGSGSVGKEAGKKVFGGLLKGASTGIAGVRKLTKSGKAPTLKRKANLKPGESRYGIREVDSIWSKIGQAANARQTRMQFAEAKNVEKAIQKLLTKAAKKGDVAVKEATEAAAKSGKTLTDSQIKTIATEAENLYLNSAKHTKGSVGAVAKELLVGGGVLAGLGVSGASATFMTVEGINSFAKNLAYGELKQEYNLNDDDLNEAILSLDTADSNLETIDSGLETESEYTIGKGQLGLDESFFVEIEAMSDAEKFQIIFGEGGLIYQYRDDGQPEMVLKLANLLVDMSNKDLGKGSFLDPLNAAKSVQETDIMTKVNIMISEASEVKFKNTGIGWTPPSGSAVVLYTPSQREELQNEYLVTDENTGYTFFSSIKNENREWDEYSSRTKAYEAQGTSNTEVEYAKMESLINESEIVYGPVIFHLMNMANALVFGFAEKIQSVGMKVSENTQDLFGDNSIYDFNNKVKSVNERLLTNGNKVFYTWTGEDGKLNVISTDELSGYVQQGFQDGTIDPNKYQTEEQINSLYNSLVVSNGVKGLRFVANSDEANRIKTLNQASAQYGIRLEDLDKLETKTENGYTFIYAKTAFGNYKEGDPISDYATDTSGTEALLWGMTSLDIIGSLSDETKKAEAVGSIETKESQNFYQLLMAAEKYLNDNGLYYIDESSYLETINKLKQYDMGENTIADLHRELAVQFEKEILDTNGYQWLNQIRAGGTIRQALSPQLSLISNYTKMPADMIRLDDDVMKLIYETDETGSQTVKSVGSFINSFKESDYYENTPQYKQSEQDSVTSMRRLLGM